MSSIKILHDVIVYNALTAISSIHVDDLVVAHTANIPDVTTLKAASGDWTSTYTTVQQNSAWWNNTYSVVSVNSADWDTAYTYATTYSQNSANPSFATLTVVSSLSVHGDLLVDGALLSSGVNLSDIFEPKGHGLRYTTDIIGDGSSTSFTFNHNLSTADLVVNITDKTTSEVIYTYVAVTSTSIHVEFSDAFAGPRYRLVALGNIPTSVFINNSTSPQTITSVAGRTGDISLSSSDITTPVSLFATSRVLSLDDVGSIVQINSVTDTTVTIPNNTSVPIPIGSQIVVVQKNTGQITLSGDSGVVVLSNGFKKKTSAIYSFASLIKLDVNEWMLGGDITT